MTLASASSSAPNNPAGTPTAPPQATVPMKAAAAAAAASHDNDGITPLQFAMAAVILGASAGLTLYTKKTGHMLSQLERASKNATQRKGPQKFGPKTKLDWEKTRNRWEKDDM